MNNDMVNLFHYYLHEREKIRLRKEIGAHPLTEDEILQTYKFTNVMRSEDRTTRWVKTNWYDLNRDQPYDVQVLNCAIFRYFGTSEFAEAIGYQYTWNPQHLVDTAAARIAAGQKVFTGAYIITNGGISAPKYAVVVGNYLQPLREAIPSILDVAGKTQSWQATAEVVRKLPGMGAFMTKEFLLDVMLTPVLENAVDKLTWTPVGPGAIRGLNRINLRPVEASLRQDVALNEIKDLLTRLTEMGFAEWMPKIGTQFGITDVQFALCEFDKYNRVKNEEGRPRSLYKPSKEKLP